MDDSQEKQVLDDLIINEITKGSYNLDIIDARIGSNEYGFIDFLCADSEGHIVAVKYFTEQNSPDLVAILNNYKFVHDLRGSFNALYPGKTINTETLPRIILIAPKFSSRFLRSIFFVDSVAIELSLYTVELHNGQKKLKLTSIPRESKISEKKVKNMSGLKKRLRNSSTDVSDEEINTFVKFYE